MIINLEATVGETKLFFDLTIGEVFWSNGNLYIKKSTTVALFIATKLIHPFMANQQVHVVAMKEVDA